MDFPVDGSREKAVEGRRAAEAERKARIFSTRSRVMGVDLSTLDQQVEERQLQRDAERQREKAFGKQGDLEWIRVQLIKPNNTTKLI